MFLDLITDFSKVTGYNITIQKPSASLYTSNEHVKTKIKNIIPFTITKKKQNYLGFNLTKPVQDLDAEN